MTTLIHRLTYKQYIEGDSLVHVFIIDGAQLRVREPIIPTSRAYQPKTGTTTTGPDASTPQS